MSEKKLNVLNVRASLLFLFKIDIQSIRFTHNYYVVLVWGSYTECMTETQQF